MNITIKDNKLTVGDFNTRLSNVLYIVSEDKCNVTFTFNSGVVKTVSVADTSVNGVQMTADNIDTLLAPIFNAESCSAVAPPSDTTPSSDCCDYTKADYSQPLVFPTPKHNGHIVDFFKDGELYENYVWNGWFWECLSYKPSLIFKYRSGAQKYGANSVRNINHWGHNGDTYFAYVQEGVYLSSCLYINSIIKNEKESDVSLIGFDINELSRETETISKFITDAPTGEVNLGYEDLDQDLFSVPTKKINVENVGSYLHFRMNAAATSFSGNKLKTRETYMGFADGSFEVKCNDFSLKDSEVYFSTIAICPIGVDYPKVAISNTSLNKTLSISFEADTYSDGLYHYVKQADIDITGSTGYTALSISSKDSNTQIQNFKLDLDTTSLTSVSINNLSFSDAAFSALFNSLTAVSVNNLPLTYEACNPALTDAQKTALINAGWKI